MVTRIKCHTEDPQILDVTVENFFATATWRPEFVQRSPKQHELLGP